MTTREDTTTRIQDKIGPVVETLPRRTAGQTASRGKNATVGPKAVSSSFLWIYLFSAEIKVTFRYMSFFCQFAVSVL